jgi:hypothetical protein
MVEQKRFGQVFYSDISAQHGAAHCLELLTTYQRYALAPKLAS